MAEDSRLRSLRRRLRLGYLTLALAIANIVSIFWGGPAWISWLYYAVAVVWIVVSFRGYLQAKRRAEVSGLRLVDVICKATTLIHHEHHGFCAACQPLTVWPCSDYLHAMAMTNEPDKVKLKFLRDNEKAGNLP